MSMQFQKGQFLSFRALNKIHIGRYTLDIGLNDQFEYDGHTVRYNGMEYGVPQLRGLLGDWYVPVEDQASVYEMKPANVKVSHATPGARERDEDFTMAEAVEEEAVVGTVEGFKASRDATQTNSRVRPRRRQADQQVSTTPAPSYQQAEVVLGGGSDQGANQDTSDMSQEEVARANAINKQALDRKMAELNERDPYRARDSFGGSRHDSPDDDGQTVAGGKFPLIRNDDTGGSTVERKYRFSDGASVGSQVVESGGVKSTQVKGSGNYPLQVGQAVVSSEQRKAGAQVLEDTEPQPNQPTANEEARPSRSGDDLEELFDGSDVAVAGKVGQKPEVDEIQEIVDGWDTKRNWQKRVKEAVDFYADWPEALEAIFSIESDAVVRQIKSRLAEDDDE